ncbi:uncharacterized protein LOC142985191 isoform X5 [Anticarsia gemmatalis]|uniref:uncharacterized protein LOC142985191 isoform X5 n=1 Tax=Anticarsia gemmatalis TaxID=129554 RepID=UPI003F76A3BE
MDFEQIVVKEGPGLCRCCLTEGCYKDLGKEYTWMNETEVYADMLLECFDISITQHNEGPNGPNRLICEVCITRLRDACYFKKQVQDSEKKFIDMMGRGEFRSKNAGATDTVVIFQQQMKTEAASDVPANVVDAEVEFLDEEIGFADDAEDDDTIEDPEPSVSDITVSSLPIKGKRGRPKKTTAKTDKKAKIAKLDDKPKAVKSIGKAEEDPIRDEERRHTRRLITDIIETTTAMPFRKNGNTYRCFYCNINFYYASELRSHTFINHKNETARQIKQTVNKNVCRKNLLVKIDCTDLKCKLCPAKFIELKDLVFHLRKHNRIVTDNLDNIIKMKLKDDEFKCLYCDKEFPFFKTLYLHLHREHVKRRFICESCGIHFTTSQGLNHHSAHIHKNESFDCQICGKTFFGEHLRAAHIKRSHDPENIKCKICGKILGSVIQKETHMAKEHDYYIQEFKCDKCDKSFRYNHMLVRHTKRVHLKEKNYICNICGDRFFERKLLQLHKIKHSTNKPFECSICFKRFPRQNALHRHVKTHDKPLGPVVTASTKQLQIMGPIVKTVRDEHGNPSEVGYTGVIVRPISTPGFVNSPVKKHGSAIQNNMNKTL